MAVGVVCLLIILGLQLALSVRRESQTWDEGNHIYAGYMSWIHADFGLNPEHPPMLKLLATAPLLSLPLKAPKLQDRYFKEEAFLGGKDFLYQNDADMILFRTRMAAATLTLLLALLVFLATKEMFGTGAAFIALALLAFEPNLLAHGALVTTDAGFFLFHVRDHLRVLPLCEGPIGLARGDCRRVGGAGARRQTHGSFRVPHPVTARDLRSSASPHRC